MKLPHLNKEFSNGPLLCYHGKNFFFNFRYFSLETKKCPSLIAFQNYLAFFSFIILYFSVNTKIMYEKNPKEINLKKGYELFFK